MLQHAVDPWSFARPPPPGFFGLGTSCARQAVVDVAARLRPPPPGFSARGSSCARQAAATGVPAGLRTPPPGLIGFGSFHARQAAAGDAPARHRPPPPGFSRPSRAACEIPVPPRIPKRAAPPADAAEKPSSKRQRLCSDYDDDIDANLRQTEKNPGERPLPDYLKTAQQDRVSPSARASLVGWMDALVRRYDLADGTPHHAVAYLDRFLSVRAMDTHGDYELRLLGAAAVFVAAKYQDRYTVLALDADKIVQYGGFASRKEVLDTERRMVDALGYQLSGPTAHTFVARFTRYAQGEEELKIQRMAHRLADRSLLDYACLGYLPSVVAASAVFLARFAINPPAPDVPAWSEEMQKLTGYQG